MRPILKHILAILILASPFAPSLSAQTESGSISGLVTDTTGAVVAGATVTVTDIGTNGAQVSKSAASGAFSFSSLRPSHYKITVAAPGFKLSVVDDVEVHTQDSLAENVVLSVGSSSDTVNVTADAEQLETSAAIATTVDRKFIENMPLNGRSFQSLIALTPGNVTAKTSYTNTGQFSVNGQRTDANYFSIDGVSANVGITQGNNTALGSAGAGAQQATSNNGGYNNLVSVDDMQEYKLQTSSFDAEYGRSPGAQLSIVTRSGTNQFHGTAFEYLRNDIFDANNWFNDNAGLPRTAEKQNDFGGVFGGPLWHNKLFFFGSYEGLRLRVPETKQDVVPTTYARNQASPVIATLLDAYPLPSAGQDLPGQWIGLLNATFSDPSTLNATSVRLDYSVTPKLNLFVRGDYAPSSGGQYGAFDVYTRSTYGETIANLNTITAGATYIVRPNIINDFRYNISHSKGATTVIPIAFDGSTPPSSQYLFQSNPNFSLNSAVFILNFSDSTSVYYVGNDDTNHQRQLNFVDTLSWSLGKHTIKFGGDYRRLTPIDGTNAYNIHYKFASVQAFVQQNSPVFARTASGGAGLLRPDFNNLSFFAQDAWQVNRRMTLNYGLRWDYDPPPGETSGHPFYTATNLSTPANVALAPVGTPLWTPSKHNFGPRMGISYVLNDSPTLGTVVRGGGGIYYGLANQQGAQGTQGAPYSGGNSYSGAAGAYPISVAKGVDPPFNTTGPYTYVFAFLPNLRDPKIYMWNVAVQQHLGTSRSLSISYVANLGNDLLRNEMLTPAMGGNASISYLDITTNNDYSNYNSLQVQYKQSPWQHMQLLASYTWGHSLDNGSGLGVPVPSSFVYNPKVDYGNSDNDVHNSFDFAVTYELPGTGKSNNALSYITNGWALDSLFRANSALPVPVYTGVYDYGLVYNSVAVNQWPNIVPGQPFYKSVSTAPGRRIINAAAFSTPSNSFSQGNLGRNVIRGFPTWQEDLALRREFPVHDAVKLLFRAEAFNLFNHPLFGDVGGNDGRNLLTSPYFGISSETLASSLGGGGADGGFSSLYQIGSPRSLQLALKLQF